MKDFLDAVREKRRSEITAFLGKGYLCNAKTYKFFDHFSAFYDDRNSFTFAVFATQSDAWFMSIEEYEDKGERKIVEFNEYLSINELYRRIRKADPLKLVNKALEGEFEDRKIIYQKSLFSFPFPKLDNETEKCLIDSGLMELVVLLCLIQAKSNLFFANGQYKDYQNGILRLFQAFSIAKSDHPALQRRGWNYNPSIGLFENDDNYLECAAIRIVFNGNSDARFAESLKRANDPEEKANVFIDEYNLRYGAALDKTVLNDKDRRCLLVPSDLAPKEFERIKTMKSYCSGDQSSFYTTNPIYIGANQKSYLLLIWKLNKKYYLTEAELEEIIKSNPSKPSIDDGGKGSVS